MIPEYNICFKWAGLMAVGFMIFTGCAHTVPVIPNPPLQTGVDRIPFDVGLFVSEEFRNFKVSEYKMGDQWNYTNLGAASASQFKLCLDQQFLSVELVDRIPPFADENKRTVHAVLEPIIDQFDFDIPLTKFQVYPARIRYRIKVYDVEGNIILRDEVEGIGDTQGQPGFDFTENPSKSASKAVEDGVRKAVEKIVRSDKIIRLLEFGNIHNPQADKGDFKSAQTSPGQFNAAHTSISELEAEKLKIAEEEAQIARLRQELAQLKAESGQGQKAETPKLAAIPRQVQAAKVTLRKKPKELTERDIKNMLLKYHFFEIHRYPIGSFANEFVDNQDDTITDTVTGLMWQKGGSGKPLENKDAVKYIKQLNKRRFAGYADWRMPTVEELASLLEKNKKSGAHIDPIFDTQQRRCWGSDKRTEIDDGHYGGWMVRFSDGGVRPVKWATNRAVMSGWARPFNDNNYVRAVRSLE